VSAGASGHTAGTVARDWGTPSGQTVSCGTTPTTELDVRKSLFSNLVWWFRRCARDDLLKACDLMSEYARVMTPALLRRVTRSNIPQFAAHPRNKAQ
jgi:hypothetical protein